MSVDSKDLLYSALGVGVLGLGGVFLYEAFQASSQPAVQPPSPPATKAMMDLTMTAPVPVNISTGDPYADPDNPPPKTVTVDCGVDYFGSDIGKVSELPCGAAPDSAPAAYTPEQEAQAEALFKGALQAAAVLNPIPALFKVKTSGTTPVADSAQTAQEDATAQAVADILAQSPGLGSNAGKALVVNGYQPPGWVNAGQCKNTITMSRSVWDALPFGAQASQISAQAIAGAKNGVCAVWIP